MHWSDGVAIGLTIGIAVFMGGWYLREHRDQRGADTSRSDGSDVA